MTATRECKPQEVLDYWLGPRDQLDLPSSMRTSLWLNPLKTKMRDIDQRFRSLVKKAHEGGLDHWAQDSQGALALIIVLNIFSGLIFGDVKLSYECDERALLICEAGLEKGLDHQLSLMERVFFYMPLRSSEDLEMQRLSVAKFKELLGITLEDTKAIYEHFFESAMSHFDLIMTFKRFPWWNEALGRQTTEEENQFLKQLRGSEAI